MKYAKGDFQLEKHKVSLCLCFLFSVLCFRICFCLFLCAFSVLSLYLLFCFVFCFVATYLPGRNCSRTLTFFVRFRLLSLSHSLHQPQATTTRRTARCAPDVALSFPLSLLYTTLHAHSLTSRLVLLLLVIFFSFYFFCCSADCFRFAWFCLYLVSSCFNFFSFLSFLLLRTFYVGVLRFFCLFDFCFNFFF